MNNQTKKPDLKIIKRPNPKYLGRDKLIRHIDELIEEKACCNIQINIFKGGIGTWVTIQTHKPED